MNPFAWRRLVALVSLLAAPGCLVEPVDFTGKKCTSAADCPDGYRCNLASRTCVSSAQSPDGSLLPRDGSLPGDAALAKDATVDPSDAEIVEPADADVALPADGGSRADGAVIGDTGVQSSDASTARDGGTPPDATVVAPPDAGSGCRSDTDCKAQGAFFCGAGGLCLPCNTDQKCGASCTSCGLGSFCDGTACQPCNSDLKCGLSCAKCDLGFACNGTACQPCITDDTCGPGCSACGAGRYCAPVAGQYACLACDTPQRCGASCSACDDELPACNGSACVECSATVPCSTGFCVNDRCVQCRESSDCLQVPGVSGQWCDTSTNTCQPCNDAQHCGPACNACLAPLPACNGSACVECLLDVDCVGNPRGPTCCKSRCIANEVPKLAGFSPLTAPAASKQDLTLYGAGFNECSVVELDGVPMPVSWLGASNKLGATVTTPTKPGPLPVVVRNPGPGGGVSSPNSAVLGPDFTLGSIAAGVAYVPGADLVAFAGTNSPYRIQTIDPATFTLAGTIKPLASSPVFLGAGTDVVLVTDNDYVVHAFGQFPTGGETPIPAFGQGGQIDIDDAARVAVVAFDNPDGYDLLDLDQLTRYANITFNVGLCCEHVGVAFDSIYAFSPFMAWNHGAGFAPASTNGAFTQLFSQQIRRKPLADRKTHRILMLDDNQTLHEYDIKGQSQLTTIPMLPGGEMELVDYPWGPQVLIVSSTGTYGLFLIDWASRTLLGGVGAGRARWCSGSDKGVGDPDGITIDPTRNRAFIANSCGSRTIEGWNLNLLFVQ